MSRGTLVVATLGCALVWLACAAGPPAPAAGRSTLAGRVRLVPPAAAAAGASGGAYGDRRMRDVSRVDYSRPGFAVVYVDGDPSEVRAAPTVVLTIVDGTVRPGVDPADQALRAGDHLVVHNAARDAHLISLPELGVLTTLEPDARLELPVARTGALALHLLDHPGVSARLFVASGPFDRVSRDGRYAIADLAPGRHRVHVWHPRLPPAARTVELEPDTATRLDWALGVGAREE